MAECIGLKRSLPNVQSISGLIASQSPWMRHKERILVEKQCKLSRDPSGVTNLNTSLETAAKTGHIPMADYMHKV